MKKYISIFIAIFFIATCVFLIANNKNNQETKEEIKVKNYTFLKLKNGFLKMEIVNDIESRNLGLSGRKGMREDEGMLFVFDKVGNYPFWMKDMNFSIDIIWLDENKKIVFIKENATPESFPTSFGGEEESLYVIEALSGFVKEHNLEIGDTLEFAF